jgi:carboxyl-terminal processing protease
VAAVVPARAQDAPPPAAVETARVPLAQTLGALFDAVVEAVDKSFWDRERLAETGWLQRAASVRPEVIAAANLQDAARRINAFLGELRMSHTVLLTPDEVEYYILKNVFGNSVRFAGIGLFSVRIDGRDFVDAVLEGFPADRAGLKIGDEIVSVDGAPYHPVRSFRGKAGRHAAVAIRRAEGGATETLSAEVVSIEPLQAFADAMRSSARVIERGGRRIGYVHVWASTAGMEEVFAEALTTLGLPRTGEQRRRAATVPPVEALIVDMRGKIGGNSGTAGRYLDLIDPRGPNIVSRGPKRGSWGRSVRGRNAVLIDHHTRSTGELFVHAYKRERQGPLIGTRTAGAVSAGWGVAMPADALLHVATTGLEVDGEILEGVGVAPDIEVARAIPYANGKDPVLDAALDTLAQRLDRDTRTLASP